MKKKIVCAGAVEVLVLAAFHVIAFVPLFAHTAAFWISYGFTMAAFLVSAISMYIGFVKKPNARSRLCGMPVVTLGVIYGAMQLALALAAMALGMWVPGWACVPVYGIALGAAVAGIACTEATEQ